jgi:hypothetical protein
MASVSASQSIPELVEALSTREPLIFTFFIYTHGSVRDLELSIDDNKLLNRCRLFSETGHNLGITCSIPDEDYMQEQTRKDIFGPMYDFFTNRGADFSIKPMASITFNKILGATPWEMDGLLSDKYGIYLLSVHRKMASGLNVFIKLPYWNLLKIDDLKKFARHFNRDDIILPTTLTGLRTWTGIGFRKWTGLDLDTKSKYIIHIKMTKFIEIIKSIVGNNAYFNLLDFSCSVNKANMSAYPWHTQIADRENMEGGEIWGGQGLERNQRVERNQRAKRNKRTEKRKTNRKYKIGTRKSKNYKRKKVLSK